MYFLQWFMVKSWTGIAVVSVKKERSVSLVVFKRPCLRIALSPVPLHDSLLSGLEKHWLDIFMVVPGQTESQ